MEHNQGHIQERSDQFREVTARLRLLARGTPVRAHTSTGSMVFNFLEMKRTRVLAECP